MKALDLILSSPSPLDVVLQVSKRFKGEPLPSSLESDLAAFPPRCTPPASAPPQPRPHGSPFFSGDPPSPPRSAPPLGEDLAPSDLSLDKVSAASGQVGS